MERPRERQHAAVRASDRAQRGGEEPRDDPRELLRQEQDDGREGEDAGALRLRRAREAAAPRRCRRPHELLPARRRRGAHRDGARSRSATCRWPPATTSSASISRMAASSTCCSACSGSPSRIRARTTTPAGRSRYLRNLQVHKIDDKGILEKPMALAAADFKGVGTIVGSGRTLVIDHTTDSNLATFRFANAEGEDVGRRTGVRPGRPPLRRRRVHHSERGSRRARAADQGAGAGRVGHRHAAQRADARPRRAAHRLPALLVEHAGRGLGADGVRPAEDPLHLLRRQPRAAGQPPREVRRHRLPGGAGAGRWRRHSRGRNAAAVQEDRPDAEHRDRAGPDRRQARQSRPRSACGRSRRSSRRAACSLPRARRRRCSPTIVSCRAS